MSREHVDGAASKRGRVLMLLADGQWHRTAEIESAAVGGSQGTRRLRELRAAGHRIIKRRAIGSTQFEYRLCKPVRPPEQRNLFDRS